MGGEKCIPWVHGIPDVDEARWERGKFKFPTRHHNSSEGEQGDLLALVPTGAYSTSKNALVFTIVAVV